MELENRKKYNNVLKELKTNIKYRIINKNYSVLFNKGNLIKYFSIKHNSEYYNIYEETHVYYNSIKQRGYRFTEQQYALRVENEYKSILIERGDLDNWSYQMILCYYRDM